MMKQEETKMRILITGGEGTISSAITEKLCKRGDEVYLLNRGHHLEETPRQAHVLIGDVHDEAQVKRLIDGLSFDVVCEFLCFDEEDAKRDLRLYVGKTRQFIFISTASAYQKPVRSLPIRETTPLENPYWEYSRKKIRCEKVFLEAYRSFGFPLTIVRPSHTYSVKRIPVGIHGKKGPYEVLARMKAGKPVLIPGDGTSLWALTFNEDFAIGFLSLLGNPKSIGEAYHIVGDEILTWNEIYETEAKLLGVPLRAVHVPSEFLAEVGKVYGYDFGGSLLGDKANSVLFDNAKIKSLCPEMGTHVKFEEGAKRVIEYLDAHPKEQIRDPKFGEFTDKVVAALEKVKQEF